MSNLYNRKLEQFQAKLQQNLDLADEEIDRLTQYLQFVKLEIIDTSDQIHRYETQYIQNKQEKSGFQLKMISKKNASLAKMEAEHQNSVVELRKDHIKKMNSLREDFDKSMTDINSQGENVNDKELQQYDLEIKRLEAKINRTSTRISGISSENVDDDGDQTSDQLNDEEATYLKHSLDLQKQKIKYLQGNIKQRDSERLEALQEAKDQLNHAVSTLENLEAQYLAKMNNYKESLENMDKQYHKNISNLEKGQQKTIIQVKKKLVKYNQRISELRKNIKKTEESQQRKISEMTEKRNNFIAQYTQIANKTIEMPNTEETHEVERQLDNLKVLLTQKETELDSARAENQNLKREIGRINHENKMAKRRAALGLQ